MTAHLKTAVLIKEAVHLSSSVSGIRKKKTQEMSVCCNKNIIKHTKMMDFIIFTRKIGA